MVGKKMKNTQVALGNGGGFQRKSSEPIDQWGFLEEIEAPMWVDLTLESKFIYQDIDDHWFQVTHPFHEHSSRYLISGIYTSSEEKACSDGDLLGLSSPKLPSSVSRSRGKDFRSREWRGDDRVPVGEHQEIRKSNGGIQRKGSARGVKTKTSSGDPNGSSSMKAGSVSKVNRTDARPNATETKCRLRNPRHTSSWRPSLVGESSSTEAMRPSFPPAKHGSVYLRNSLSLTSSSIGESNLTGNSGPESFEASYGNPQLRSSSIRLWDSTRAKYSFGDSESTLSQDAVVVGESNSAGPERPASPKPKPCSSDLKSSLNSKVNNATESSQQEMQMVNNVSRIFDQPREFLSAVRINLQKRCVTRQPSRVEIKDKRQLKGFKSSLSNSSLGFTSSSGCNIKNKLVTAATNQGRNTHGRNFNKMDKRTKHEKEKGRNASKMSIGPLMDLMSRPKLEGKTTNVKCVHQEPSETKVLHQIESRKPALMPNAQDPSIVHSKGKKSEINRSQVKTRGRIASSRKADGKENNNRISIAWNQKSSKHIEVKDEKGLSNPKVKAHGRSKPENPKRMVERIYFR